MKHEQDLYAEPVLRVVVINKEPAQATLVANEELMRAVKKPQEMILLGAPTLPQFNDYRIKARAYDPL
ncbi:MAG: hypothetical protein QM731_15965 [Chitinophagaceae bacterium]